MVNYVNIYFGSGVTEQRDEEALLSTVSQLLLFFKSGLISLSIVLADWKASQGVGRFFTCGSETTLRLSLLCCKFEGFRLTECATIVYKLIINHI